MPYGTEEQRRGNACDKPHGVPQAVPSITVLTAVVCLRGGWEDTWQISMYLHIIIITIVFPNFGSDYLQIFFKTPPHLKCPEHAFARFTSMVLYNTKPTWVTAHEPRAEQRVVECWLNKFKCSYFEHIYIWNYDSNCPKLHCDVNEAIYCYML